MKSTESACMRVYAKYLRGEQTTAGRPRSVFLCGSCRLLCYFCTQSPSAALGGRSRTPSAAARPANGAPAH